MQLLYAEDEEEMSEAVVDILTYHKYTVDAVYDGEEALSYAHAEQYDGIILDVMMPKKSGLQVLKELRAEGCKTPILLLTAKASRENLIQLISILFDNAVKYASEGGYIDVSLKKSGRELVLQVKNTCEKLPEVEPEKLFERFYRGDAARTQKSGGYGIGLSAARAIALAHGGTLGASYEKDDIICFTLRLKEP